MKLLNNLSDCAELAVSEYFCMGHMVEGSFGTLAVTSAAVQMMQQRDPMIMTRPDQGVPGEAMGTLYVETFSLNTPGYRGSSALSRLSPDAEFQPRKRSTADQEVG